MKKKSMINITFSKLVKMNGRLWEVNYRKLSGGPNLFHADTATLQGDRIQFLIHNDNGSGWRITGLDPASWLNDHVQSLGAAVDRGLQEHYPSSIRSELSAM